MTKLTYYRQAAQVSYLVLFRGALTYGTDGDVRDKTSKVGVFRWQTE